MIKFEKTIFETAKEFFDALPLPDEDVYVVFEGNHHVEFSGENSHKYGFATGADRVTQSSMIEEMFARLGGNVYIT